MNRMDNIDTGPAKIRYLDADFQIIAQGSFVICAVTGDKIPLDELKYWSVARQEAYRDANASYLAEQQNQD